MSRTPLTNTMEPVIKTKDIMEKFNVSRGTALKFLEQEELHSYYIGKALVCEKQYFDALLEKNIEFGGTRHFS